MTHKELKKKYPGLWRQSYKAAVEELKEHMIQADVERFNIGEKPNRIDIIAHNLAFRICMYVRETKYDTKR